MGRVESLTVDISMASAAARPANIVKPLRMRERAEGGDTGVKAGKEDLSVSMQMEESGNTDIIAMRAKEEKREWSDTVQGSEFNQNYFIYFFGHFYTKHLMDTFYSHLLQYLT